MTTEDLIREVTGNLKDLISADCVIGSPVDLGNKILIPVTRFGLAFGGCAGRGTGGDGSGDGSGGGAGGGIDPVAVIISHKDITGAEGIQIFSLKKENPVAQVITALGESLVPQVIDLLKKKDAKESAEPEKAIEPESS